MTPFREVVPRLRQLLAPPAAAGDADGALVARFAATRDEAAFAELVRRHGPLVRGVCRRALGPDAADDAFQATFLVLARNAGSIRRPAAVGSWLYGVAYRLCRQARRRIQRREHHEGAARDRQPEVPRPPDPAAAAVWADVLAVLDEELARLPERLRAPLLLCYLDGRTQDEAARQLGWSLGTVRRRLDRARDLLRARMERRGATLSAGLFATLLAADAVTAAVPAALARGTVDMARTFLAGGAVAPAVAALARGGLPMLSFPKITAAAALAVLFGGLTVGAGALLRTDEKKSEARNPKSEVPTAQALPVGAMARLGTARFRHGADVLAIHVTPDGATVLTQGVRSVRLWDARTGADRGGLDLTDDGPGFWTSSLTPDGRTLLTTRLNGTAQVWDLEGRALRRSFRLAAAPFDVSGPARAAHAPDGSAIAVVTADGSLRVCDVAAGREMDQLRSHSDGVQAAVFTADSKHLLLACDTGVLRTWDVASGREVNVRGNFVVGARHLALSPDGKRLAVAAATESASPQGSNRTDGRGAFGRPRRTVELHLYDLTTGDGARALRGGAYEEAEPVFTPDGRYLLAADRRTGGRVLLQWDVETGRNMRQYPEHTGAIRALAFTPDGRTLLTADAVVRRWDWRAGQERDATAVAAGGGPAGFVLTPDGQAVASEDGDAIVVRELATGRELRRLTVPDRREGVFVVVSALAVAPNGRSFAAAGAVVPPPDSGAETVPAVWLWDLADGRLRHRFAAPAVTHLAYTADSATLAGSTAGQPAVFWDLVTGREVALLPNKAYVQGPVLGFPPDGRTLVTFDPPSVSVASWTIATGEGSPLAQFAGRQPLGGRAPGRGRPGADPRVGLDPRAAFDRGQFADGFGDGGPGFGAYAHTPDFSRFAFAVTEPNRASSLRVVETKGNEVVRQVRGVRPAIAVALTADGRRVAAAAEGESPAVGVWDVETGRELKRLAGLRGRAMGLSFTPDGRRLVAASSDGTLLVWEATE